MKPNVRDDPHNKLLQVEGYLLQMFAHTPDEDWWWRHDKPWRHMSNILKQGSDCHRVRTERLGR